MKVFRKLLIGFVLVGLFLMASCGGDNGNGGYHIAEYWPFEQGNTWVYGETLILGKTYDNMYTQTVSGTETIDGVEAIRLRIDSGGYILLTNTNGITRYKDGVETEYHRIFTPPFQDYPADMSVGRQYTAYSDVTYITADGKIPMRIASQSQTP